MEKKRNRIVFLLSLVTLFVGTGFGMERGGPGGSQSCPTPTQYSYFEGPNLFFDFKENIVEEILQGAKNFAIKVEITIKGYRFVKLIWKGDKAEEVFKALEKFLEPSYKNWSNKNRKGRQRTLIVGFGACLDDIFKECFSGLMDELEKIVTGSDLVFEFKDSRWFKSEIVDRFFGYGHEGKKYFCYRQKSYKKPSINKQNKLGGISCPECCVKIFRKDGRQPWEVRFVSSGERSDLPKKIEKFYRKKLIRREEQS